MFLNKDLAESQEKGHLLREAVVYTAIKGSSSGWKAEPTRCDVRVTSLVTGAP